MKGKKSEKSAVGGGAGGLEVRMNRVGERAKNLLFEPGDTLSQRVVRGGFRVFALRLASRALTLMRTIVLARVLAPSDFGLMGIALLAVPFPKTPAAIRPRKQPRSKPNCVPWDT